MTGKLVLVGPRDKAVTLDELLAMLKDKTLQDIARKLGTSQSTLSRFLNANGYHARRHNYQWEEQKQ